jgi:hypothetical protein
MPYMYDKAGYATAERISSVQNTNEIDRLGYVKFVGVF